MAHRQTCAEPGELRQDVDDRSVVVEPALLVKDHREHGGELLRDGRDVESGARPDRDPSLDIGQSQGRGVDHGAVPDHHHGGARDPVAPQRLEERVESFLRRRGARQKQS